MDRIGLRLYVKEKRPDLVGFSKVFSRRGFFVYRQEGTKCMLSLRQVPGLEVEGNRVFVDDAIRLFEYMRDMGLEPIEVNGMFFLGAKIIQEQLIAEMDGKIATSANVVRIKIPGVTNIWNPKIHDSLVVAKNLGDIAWEADKEWFKRFGIVVVDTMRPLLCPNDHLVRRHYVSTSNVPPLSILCMRALSSYNHAFGGTRTHSYVVNGYYDQPAVLRRQIPKLLKNVVTFGPSYQFIDTFRGMMYYYRFCVDLKPKQFRIKGEDLMKYPYPNSTKNGYSKFETNEVKVTKCEGIKIRWTDSPTKYQARHAERRKLAELYRKITAAVRNTNTVPIEKPSSGGITSIAVKDYNINLHWDEAEKPDPSTYSDKGRMFYITQDLQKNRIFKDRHSERTYYPKFFPTPLGGESFLIGFRNDIGQKWIYGGAQLKYEALRGWEGDKWDFIDGKWVWVSSGDRIWAEFDISGLDLSILAQQLALYMYAGKYWIIEEDCWEYRFYLYALEMAVEALSGRVMKWMRDFVIIMGVMPSGSSETSHGNTWIVIVCGFLSFIFYVIRTVDWSIGRQIMRALYHLQILAIVYGDDSNYTYPKHLRDYIGVERLQDFLMRMYRWQLRNVREYTSLISYLKWDPLNGFRGYYYEGPTYLKRKYVLYRNFGVNIDQVVPWRPTVQYMWRCAMPKHRQGTVIQVLARLIGLAYDTMGVDSVQYSYVKNFFVVALKMAKPEFRSLTTLISEQLLKDDKFLRKVGLKTVPPTFPTLAHLRSINVMDRRKHEPPHASYTWQDWITHPDYEDLTYDNI